MSSRARSEAQQTITAVAAALASSRDPDDCLIAAARTVGEVLDASRVEIWSFANSPAVAVMEAEWSTDGATTVELDARPDLRAVRDGGGAVEWCAGASLPEEAASLLSAIGATRLMSVELAVEGECVGGLVVAHAGATTKLTAAEKRRVRSAADLLAAAVPLVAAGRGAEAAARRAGALRAAGRAVAAIAETDDAVEAVTQQVAALVGGRDARVGVYLQSEAGTFVPFPPRHEDKGGNGSGPGRPNDLEREALDRRETATLSVAGAVRLATPLLLRGVPLGYLSLIAARARPLDSDEIEDIETMAEQICHALDVARLRRAVQRLTTSDTLTGLRNREFLYERLTAEIARARRYQQTLSLVLLDLDAFGAFNARHGNREGNRVLRAVANLVKTCIRDNIDVACRYGGAEFALLLPNTPASAEGAGVVAERVREAIEATRFHDEDDHLLGCLTVSLGVAGFPTHAEDADDLLTLAGEALRKAKAAGKNRIGLYSLRA